MIRSCAFLIGSPLLNVVLAGALAGGAVWVRTRAPVIAAGSLRIAGSELPRAQRQAFRATIRKARRAKRAEVVESRDARADATALLRRPIVDQDAILAALARARAADMAVRTNVEESAVRFAATMRAKVVRASPMPRATASKMGNTLQHRRRQRSGDADCPICLGEAGPSRLGRCRQKLHYP